MMGYEINIWRISQHIDYIDYLPNELKDQAIQLYLHVLRDKLEPILGNDGRAQKAMRRALAPHSCIVAVREHQLVGILGLQTEKGGFLNPTLKTMIKVSERFPLK